jgi:hypothetical protein
MGRAVRAARARRGAARLGGMAAAATWLGMCAASLASAPIGAALGDLRSIIEDVTQATAYRYATTDDLGHSMDTADVVWVPEAGAFAAVYHTRSPEDGRFRVHLATSTDLLDWAWQATLAERAAQASIEPASDGGYVVAWEQSPDPIHLALAFYESWADLRAGSPGRHLQFPVTTPGCAEGTPSIERASSVRVDVTFHYYEGCRRDRQARGSTDWTSWSTDTRPQVDRAIRAVGARGHIGDRDELAWDGQELVVIEGQLVLDEPGSWRTFLYDVASRRAEPLVIRTHGGTSSLANPTVSAIEIDGLAAILVTVFAFTEGAAPGESGQLIYYRTLRSVR